METTQMTSEQRDAVDKAIYVYGELQARIDRLQAEQAHMKDAIETAMKGAGITEYRCKTATAQFRDKHTFKYNMEIILNAVPEARKYVKIRAEDYNRVLVGHEVELAEARKLVKKEQVLYITPLKQEEK